jgi:hypothetical protein
VFRSSPQYSADQLAYPGAITVCNDLAASAGLPGTYLPWLSGGGYGSPNTAFSRSTMPYELVDGTKVADSYDDLIDGTLDAAISRSESGTTPINNPVFTGTLIDGTEDTSNTCSGWSTSSNSVFFASGASAFSNNFWTRSGTVSCSATGRLYCFQQSEADPG